ncbi:MAG: DNRLRE domain-containing protein, partial [Proteobacteria bacterium]|nr:DNRLRE domain-containing protein [Pseudomonadota bacterium]
DQLVRQFTTSKLSPLECPQPELGCDWTPSYALDISGWESDLYFAYLLDGIHDVPPTDLAGNDHDFISYYNFVPIIVKAREPSSKILIQLPTNTWHAYNNVNINGILSTCFYGDLQCPEGRGGRHQHSVEVSFRRPFPRYLFRIKRDTKGLFEWLHRHNISYDVAANDDLEDYHFIAGYKLIISVGHDEYWTYPMLENTIRFRDAGGNLIFLTGNSIYWQSRWKRSSRSLVSYKDYVADDPYSDTDLATYYFSRSLDTHEGRLLGIHGNEIAGLGGYRLYNTQNPKTSWVFEGLQVYDTKLVGAASHLAGSREVDNIDYYFHHDKPIPKKDLTPHANLEILGIGDDRQGNVGAGAVMAMYSNAEGPWGEDSTVFAAGSWNLAMVGLQNDEPFTDTVMRNLLRRMASGAPVDIERPQTTDITLHIYDITDFYISASLPDVNHDSAPVLNVGNDGQTLSLLSFELPPIPQKATILSADIALTLIDHSLRAPGDQLAISVMSPSRRWQAGSITWNPHIVEDTQAGVSDRQWIYPQSLGGQTYHFDITPYLQDWWSGTRENRGIMLSGTGSMAVAAFASGEHDEEGFHPKVTLIVRQETGSESDQIYLPIMFRQMHH